jgi:hypothetical protein
MPVMKWNKNIRQLALSHCYSCYYFPVISCKQIVLRGTFLVFFFSFFLKNEFQFSHNLCCHILHLKIYINEALYHPFTQVDDDICWKISIYKHVVCLSLQNSLSLINFRSLKLSTDTSSGVVTYDYCYCNFCVDCNHLFLIKSSIFYPSGVIYDRMTEKSTQKNFLCLEEIFEKKIEDFRKSIFKSLDN